MSTIKVRCSCGTVAKIQTTRTMVAGWGARECQCRHVDEGETALPADELVALQQEPATGELAAAL